MKLKFKLVESLDEALNEENDGFDVKDKEWSERYDEKFGEPGVDVFAPGEIQKFLQEVIDFE